MTNSEKTPTRRRLARSLVLGSLVLLPIGFAAPVLAEVTVVDNDGGWRNDNDGGWRQDCDHTGQFRWQNDRGQWRMDDCDHDRGHWEWRDNDWRWHHDRDDAPAPAPTPWWWNPFGSW
ncbi:hypothetical protein GPX89_14305 [Nocardia sp. ET3-3]|uniref:Secreted protein n=1 Tax=Nocardia terrae TaxID=2675851 RepID=A0A7K1UVK0_9NOCA|nr:hypothetical protein [Nocardia terrae]MVU78413.1 hypothetical protein [Nocardia terrae]